MKVDVKNILTLAAHTDDVEIGCGASLYKFSNANIKVIAFSLAPGKDVESEFDNSMSILGVNYDLHKMQIRELGYNRQEILDVLYREANDKEYDLIF